jgi:hypothetical protein
MGEFDQLPKMKTTETEMMHQLNNNKAADSHTHTHTQLHTYKVGVRLKRKLYRRFSQLTTTGIKHLPFYCFIIPFLISIFYVLKTFF